MKPFWKEIKDKQEKAKKIKELRDQGYSYRQICKILGYKNPMTIYYWLHKEEKKNG